VSNIFSDPQVTASAIGALIGAFVALILVVTRDWVGKVYDRKHKHFDALVKLEAQAQAQGGVINDNLFILPHFANTLRNGKLYWSNLSTIPYDTDVIYELHNLDLINDIYSYHYDLRRANDDLNGIVGAYKNIEQAFIAKNIDDQTYTLNAKNIADVLDDLIIYLNDEVSVELIRIIAKVRLLIKKDQTFGMRIKSFLVGSSKVSEDSINTEIKLVKKEIEDGRRKSQIEKEKIFNNGNNRL
jgi:hypothetical protein